MDGRLTEIVLGVAWEMGMDDAPPESPRESSIHHIAETADPSANGTIKPEIDGNHSLQRRKPGRRPDAENDVAFQKYLEGGQTDEAWQAAYNYWCGEKGYKNPGRSEREAFKKAMKRARERYRGTK